MPILRQLKRHTRLIEIVIINIQDFILTLWQFLIQLQSSQFLFVKLEIQLTTINVPYNIASSFSILRTNNHSIDLFISTRSMTQFYDPNCINTFQKIQLVVFKNPAFVVFKYVIQGVSCGQLTYANIDRHRCGKCDVRGPDQCD